MKILKNAPVVFTQEDVIIGPIKPGMVVRLPKDAVLLDMDGWDEEAMNKLHAMMVADMDGIRPLNNDSKPIEPINP